MPTLLRVPLLIIYLVSLAFTCADLLNIPKLGIAGAPPVARARVKRRLSPAPCRWATRANRRITQRDSNRC